MKLTEAQKQKRIKNRLSYQKHHNHMEAEFREYGSNHEMKWVCDGCGKVFEDEPHH